MEQRRLRILLLIALATLRQCYTFAQSTTVQEIKGTTINANHEPLMGAQVRLFLISDSTQRYSTSTDERGAFSLKAPLGRYNLSISYVGYHDVLTTVNCTSDTDLKELTMVEDTQMLNEVVVTSKRLTFNAKGYSMNVMNAPLFRNNSLTETLMLLPGLNLKEGRLRAYQQDVLSVFINGKKQRLPMDDVMNMLSTMESKQIRTIEVLNSTADPEVSTQMGYVLKITTKTVDDGGQLTLGAADSQGNTRDNSFSPWFSLQERSGRWSFYAAPRWTPRSMLRRSQKSHTAYKTTGGKRTERDNFSMETKPSLNYTASISYDISANQSLMLSSSGRKSTITHRHATTNTQTDNGAESHTTGLTSRKMDIENINVALDYSGKFGKWSINTSAVYSSQQNDTRNDMTHEEKPWTGVQDMRYRVGLLRATGTWTIDSRQNATFSVYHTNWNNKSESHYPTEPGADNTFRFKEQAYAAIAAYALNTERTNIDLGLRLQHNRQQPATQWEDRSETQKHRYTYLLPSATLTYMANEEKGISLTLRYAREYDIPSMNFYEPGIRYHSDYSYETGNPHIKPGIDDQLHLQLQMGEWALYAMGSFAKSATRVYGMDEQGKEFLSMGNDAHTNSITAGLATPLLQPCNGWQLNASIYYSWKHYDYLDWTTNGGQAGLDFTSTNNLPWNLIMTLRANLQTAHIMLFDRLTDPGTVSMTVSRSWLKGALTTSIAASYSFLQKERMEVEAYRKLLSYTKPQTLVTLNMRYRLNWGNKRAQVKRKLNTDRELLRMTN